jgi:ribose-phosphate pyrophosphokinase
MLVVSNIENKKTSENIASYLNVDNIFTERKIFSDKEILINIKDRKKITNNDILIIHSISYSVNDKFFELFLMVDLLKNYGCKSIMLFLPYFGYSRQDNFQHGSCGLSIVIKLLYFVGVKKIFTCDMHSNNFSNKDLLNIDMSDLFISKLEKKNYLIISPDKGAQNKAITFAKKINSPYLLLNKIKQDDGEYLYHNLDSSLILNQDCLIIDDIIDTGKTLYYLAKKLISIGAKSITICVTHGIFSNNSLNKLAEIKFADFIVTNTIVQKSLPSWITVINMDQYVADFIRQNHIISKT